ncbi:sugar phosphate isomerase/epimerase [Aliifodinibius sp. S!AR15-10]|uniref:sugar phosphate isomerase/epimerase family protein n=1 Tax=Aliifodinibius sp. S!AR15-10 TaxID=2950437 RepID=UPI002866E691|nr:sugar phosphate isomerase/epimerase [Aliifodinibius sp. S!AR15-10]MDR8392905.1 sugar phosphate isomerase/epimerase [Aliifodinibius sp. S!AR15-10]
MKRRLFLELGAAGLLGSALPGEADAKAQNREPDNHRYQRGKSPWPICLDTATIRPASLKEKVEIADKAGFDAIEPWDGELQEYEEEGGDLKALGKEIKERGLFVPSVIGLWNALPPTQKEWEESLEDTRRRMRMAADIGSEHIQTIPNTVGENYDLQWVADRYHDIVEIGLNDYGIKPAIVFVKFFPLKTLGQATAVALDSNHPEALIIPDTFHMYISEGGFNGLSKLDGSSIAIFQFADAPGSPAADELGDEHRVFPGDGVLPLTKILKDLKETGYKGCVSLELYNPNYWDRDLQQVAQTGLQKTLSVIEEAGV